MILLATFAVCVTVNMRTRAKFNLASQQFAAMQQDVESLRDVNHEIVLPNIELAAEAGVTLIGFLRDERMTIYAGVERVRA